jgi:ABC-type sugar transport system ATPase subunit
MLIVDNVVKSFGNNDGDTSTRALDGVSLTVETGEFPPSSDRRLRQGTLLSSIAGFLQPDRYHGRRVPGGGPAPGGRRVPPGLDAWRTVAKNVAYGLTLQKVLRKDIPARVQAASHRGHRLREPLPRRSRRPRR